MSRILIVEDDENLALLYQVALKNAQFEVFSANNGLTALDIMDKQYIDLIISDIMMPDMDGYELAKSLREAGYELPILLITAKDTFEDKKKGFKLGADDYMVKPIDVNEMLLRVDALLRRAQIVHTKELTVGTTTLSQETYQIKTPEQTETLPQKNFYYCINY